ncbi:MAG: hypothetical protein FWC15_05335 [Fibromonadales bacterium]|nr:hypothetical protein [Fibromonadales bacterium]
MISALMTPEELNYLYKTLNVCDDNEKAWIKMEQIRFKVFYENTRKQPISSFIKAVELKCRELYPIFHESFNIYCETMPKGHANTKIASSWLFPDAERFRILLPSNANETEKRNLITHEVGRLYSALRHLRMECYNAEGVRIKAPEECRKILMDYLTAKKDERHEAYENRADAIGIFTLTERAKFHTEKMRMQERDFCKKVHRIVDDFAEMKKIKPV